MTGPDGPRVLMVLNPRAGGGRAPQRLERALAARLSMRNRTRLVEVTEVATVRAALESDEKRIVVAAGGDGTVNAVARLLVETETRGPMAVLPLGTGNVLAHDLGVASLDAALAAVETGRHRALDVMRSSHERVPVVIMSISVGAESRFIHRHQAMRRWKVGIGMAAGALAVFRRRCGAYLALDGEAVLQDGEPFYNAGLYNTPKYAFGVSVFPEAALDDGVAEATVDRTVRAYVGRFVAPGRTPPPRTWISATLRTSLPVQFDGEPGPSGTFELRVCPGALDVVVP